MEGNQLLSPSERSFQGAVVEFARLNGWLVYHTYDARRSEPGFPDLVLVRPPEVLFAELKSARGRPSDPQLRWLNTLSCCNTVGAALWRPADWPEIEEALARRQGSPRRKEDDE